MKTIAKCEKQKVYSGGIFVTFFVFHAPFFAFRISQHFMLGSAFVQKVKGFCGLFFRVINKKQNSHEIEKVYSVCFVFRCEFCENIHKICAKSEIQKIYYGLALGVIKLEEFVLRDLTIK